MALDPFETLGLEPRFDLDMEQLQVRHRELSRALHPDRHAGKTPAERRHALGKAIEVNDAFRQLKNPLTRARALLAKLGHAIEEGQEAKPPAELLMDMMEQREALAEVRESGDQKALAELSQTIEGRQQQAIDALTRTFAATEQVDAPKAAELMSELRYYARFLEEAGAIADEMP